jgi:hypothetical protein
VTLSRSGRTTLLALLLSATCSAPGGASAALLQSFQATGPLGLEVAGASNLGGALPTFSGTITLSGIPPGAIVQKAFLYTNDWASSGSLDLTLNSAFIGLATPFSSDTTTIITHLFAYRWDVTPFVHTPGSYTVAIGQTSRGNQIYGAALAVVWLDPLAPTATVSILDGARQVGERGPETESASFTTLPGGPTTLWVFTVADDSASSGEVVSYNGAAVGGPLDENLGLGASVLQMGTTSIPGTDLVSITTGLDHFGWLLAATRVSAPGAPTLLFVLLGGLWLLGRRHARSGPAGRRVDLSG